MEEKESAIFALKERNMEQESVIFALEETNMELKLETEQLRSQLLAMPTKKEFKGLV